MTERRRATDQAFAESLGTLSVIMVCGSGGVGKTSIAASIAVNEAMRGRRVCVLTIDPAKRLADAMGLTKLDDHERRVKLPAGAKRGGELWALMLDPKLAFDRLVSETAPDPEQQQRVLENRVYQAVSRSTAGVQEYMALERLYELDRGGKYDLIVVDTPPSAHARDLLESPLRMLRFLEGRSLRWFLKPGMKMGRFGLKAIGGPQGAIVGLLTKVTGVEMLRDTTEFFESMEGMYDHIRERIALVDRMFADDNTGFVVVSSPERSSIDQTIDFWNLIAERELSFTGSVVNRVEPTAGDDIADADDLIGLPGIDGDLAQRISACQRDHFAVAERDRERVEELRDTIAGAPVIPVPRLPRMINDLAGLADLKQYLYV